MPQMNRITCSSGKEDLLMYALGVGVTTSYAPAVSYQILKNRKIGLEEKLGGSRPPTPPMCALPVATVLIV